MAKVPDGHAHGAGKIACIAENFNLLSTAHERYRQTTDRQTDRQTDGRRHIANMNLSSRSLIKLLRDTRPVQPAGQC